MPSPHLKDTKPLSKLKSIVLDPEPRQVSPDLEDEDEFVGGIEEVDIPPYRPPTGAPQRGSYPLTPRPPAPVYTSYAPESEAPRPDPTELADLMASLVAGDPVMVQESEWSSGATWITVLRSLVKRGFVATVLYNDDAYQVTVRR